MEKFITENKNKVLFVLFFLTFFLVTFRFTETPKVWVDEGVFTATARSLSSSGTIGLQTSPGEFFSMRNFLLSTSYPVIFPVAFFFKIFGIGLWQARLTMLLYMFMLVIGFYLFIEKRHGFYTSVLSVLLLLSFSPFYGNGRPIQGEVPALALLVLGALFYLYFEESEYKDKKSGIISGILFGLSASVKPLFLVLVPVSILFSLILSRKKIDNFRQIQYFLLSLLTPIIFWCFIHFQTLKSFLNFIPDVLFFSGTHESGVSTFKTVSTNLLKFFKESTPILLLILFATTFLLIVYKKYKGLEHKDRISENVIYIFIILNLVGYLLGTGWYRYFFPANILLYIFFVSSIMSWSDIFEKRTIGKLIKILPILLIIFQFTHLIFWSDTSFVNRRTRNTEVQKVLSGLDSTKKILFYGSVETLVFWPNEYYQYFSMGNFLDTGNKDLINQNNFDYILADSPNLEFDSDVCYEVKPVDRYYLFTKTKNCR